MRIVHLMTSLNPGGVATFISYFLPELARHGIESEIVVTLDHGAMEEVLKAKGFAVHECRQHGKLQLDWSYRVGKIVRRSAILTFPTRLTKLLRSLKPDIVHSHNHADHWSIQLAASHAAQAPMLLTLHSPSSQYPKSWRARYFYKPTLRSNDRIVGLIASIYEAYGGFLDGLPPKNIVNAGTGIPYGLPDPGPRDLHIRQEILMQLGIPPEALIIGSIGRLITQKRYTDVLHAYAKLKNRYPAYLLLVGDGTARLDLEKEAEKLGIQDKVFFVGFQTNPVYWINAIDIYVLSSLFEGMPVATLEAIAKGIAFVGSEVPGTQELITHDQNGLLYPVRDSDRLAELLSRLLDSGDLRQRLGQEARHGFLENYLIDRTTEQYIDVYRDMLT